MKLLYEQCGNHVAEYYPNIIGNYDEKLPHQSEHAVDNLFPGKRVSGSVLVKGGIAESIVMY